MGIKDYEIDHMADFDCHGNLHALQVLYNTRFWQDSVIKYWPTADFDPEGRAIKMLYFNMVGSYWHVRGEDLFHEKLADKQTQQMYPLRLPAMWYIPILYDEHLEKIGGDVVLDDHDLSRLFKYDAKDIQKRLLALFGVESIDEFYGQHLQPIHRLNSQKLMVPDNWLNSE